MALDSLILKKVVNISFEWQKKELIPLKMSFFKNRIHLRRIINAKGIFIDPNQSWSY